MVYYGKGGRANNLALVFTAQIREGGSPCCTDPGCRFDQCFGVISIEWKYAGECRNFFIC